MKAPRTKPSGEPFPADWRKRFNYWAGLMMAKVPENEYEAEARAFEDYARSRLSADWVSEWRVWRDKLLIARGTTRAKNRLN